MRCRIDMQTQGTHPPILTLIFDLLTDTADEFNSKRRTNFGDGSFRIIRCITVDKKSNNEKISRHSIGLLEDVSAK